MPTGQEADEIEEYAAPASAVTGVAAGPGRCYGAAAGPGRRFKPAVPPRDLQAALAPLEDDEYGSKIFENLGVQDITPEHVKSVGEEGSPQSPRRRTCPHVRCWPVPS